MRKYIKLLIDLGNFAAFATLLKDNALLRKKLAELTDKYWECNRQIALYSYDLLCRIQDGISCIREADGITGLCIIEDIIKEPKACPSEDSFGKGCAECIANWLNEEARW